MSKQEQSERNTSGNWRSSRRLISIESISKSYRHVTALDDVSINLNRNEVVGLVGENGAGKSTLLNILTGILEPDSGKIVVDGNEINLHNPRDAAEKGISLVPQELDTIENVRAFENFYIGREDPFSKAGILNRDQMQESAQKVIDRLEIPLDVSKPMSSYSFGQKKMLEIAKAFDISSEVEQTVILLDEPIAGLEEEHRKILFDRIDDLRNEATFVFVSHELESVLNVCDRIYILKDGKVVDQTVTSETNITEVQRKMVGRETSTQFYRTSDQLRPDELGDTAIKLNNIEYKDEFGPISFDVRRKEIFGIVGVDGSGKEELGRLLAGDLHPHAGEIYVDDTQISPWTRPKAVDAGIGYIPKDRRKEGLLMYHNLVKNISLALVGRMPLPILNKQLEGNKTDGIIEQLEIKTPGSDTLIHTLSGGNQQKCVVGRWLAVDTPILVMDNATRGIDVGAKEEIYSLCRELTADGVTIIFIADELQEVIGLSNRIGVMKEQELSTIVDAPIGNKPTEEDLIQEML